MSSNSDVTPKVEPLMVPPWKLKQSPGFQNNPSDDPTEPKFSKKKWVLLTILLLLVTNALTAGYFIKQIQDTPGQTSLPVDTAQTSTENKPLIPGAPQGFLDISGPLAQTNDTQRRAHLATLGSALEEYVSEESGPPKDFPTSPICIGKSQGCYDLEPILVPHYLPEIPKDPTIGTEINSGYTVYVDEAHSFVLDAVGEIEPVITIRK